MNLSVVCVVESPNDVDEVGRANSETVFAGQPSRQNDLVKIENKPARYRALGQCATRRRVREIGINF